MHYLSRAFALAVGIGIALGCVTFWQEYSTCGYQGCSRNR